jgi:hypothetical protein
MGLYDFLSVRGLIRQEESCDLYRHAAGHHDSVHTVQLIHRPLHQ